MTTAQGTVVPKQTPAATPARKGDTLSSQVWRRLRRDPFALVSLALIILFTLMALLADWIAPANYATQTMGRRFEAPNPSALFGADQFGRDVLSRVIYGARVSMSVGLISVGIGALLGVPIGAIAGYFGRKVDTALMFVMDVLIAFPSLLLAIAIAAALGPSIQNAMIAVGVVNIPQFARLVRSSVLSIRNMDYVEAARAMGANNTRIIGLHILPNILPLVIVRATLGIAFAILTEAGLSFIGLGVQPPFPSWGGMLNEGREFLRRAAHITVIPGIFIMLTVLAFNLLGDSLRDALDPRLKQ
jgi:peptide/nickel transport system permease protein